jgi:hypothetical protein
MGVAEQVVECNGGIPQKLQHVRLRRIWFLVKNIPRQITLPCGFPPGKRRFLYSYSVNDSGDNAGSEDLNVLEASHRMDVSNWKACLIKLSIQRHEHFNRTQENSHTYAAGP